MNLFPMIQPQAAAQEKGLPLYREVKWDFKRNQPVFENGAPVQAEGAEAVLVWAWKALQTPRFRYDIYSWGYGNELESLVGKNFTEELKRSEAVRYIRECLKVNPYVTEIGGVTVEFQDNRLSISGSIETVYGRIQLEGLHV